MEIRKSTEMELDAFLKLPRKAQLLMFEELSRATSDKNNLWKYTVIDFNTSSCKSPIEQIFYFAYEIYYADHCNECHIALEPQLPTSGQSGKTYYPDFRLFDYEADEYLPILIECDGHEYHQKTKAQVKRDNERDYDLKMAGYEILHFSGSQIYNDPMKCVEDAFSFGKAYCEKHKVELYETD